MGKFSDSDIETKLAFDTSISYSDHGLIAIKYKDILNSDNFSDSFTFLGNTIIPDYLSSGARTKPNLKKKNHKKY